MGILRSFGIHAGQRFHAATHKFLRSTDAKETAALFAKVEAQVTACGVVTENDRQQLLDAICGSIADALDLSAFHEAPLAMLVRSIANTERLFQLPVIDWQEQHSVSEWWAIKDELHRQQRLFGSLKETVELFERTIIETLEPFIATCPALSFMQSTDNEGIVVPSQLIHLIGNGGTLIEHIIAVLNTDEVSETNLFPGLVGQLERNIVAASGGNPADIRGFSKTPVLPTKSSIKSPAELADKYLNGTPFNDFLQQNVAFSIPEASRFEHQHIIAGTGHGKTQTLQYLIARDLEQMVEQNRSVIVIDSQGDLIRNIAGLAEFAPGGPLHDRVVIIDPTDVEYPVSLNLFDVGIERLAGYAPLEKERLTNSILELYDFVLGSLLSAEMTQKQNVIFRYVTRLMLHIPNATIHTLRELMEPDSHLKFAEHIEKLEGSARHFFETEFKDKEFSQTRKQVLRRLWGILENQTFERMFSHPKSKLDLYSEMNAGKVILINTAKDLLKEQGSEIFGRFFIALIAQAAQERATLPADKRTPTFVYVDEAADYFDRNIGIILAQARKYKVGMVLAHQYLGQLDAKLQDAFAANTAIKFAGGVSAKDARTLASMLSCEPGLIEAQPKGNFAASIRGVTTNAIPLAFPFGYLESKKRMSEHEEGLLRDVMRERHAVPYAELGPTPEESVADDDTNETTESPTSEVTCSTDNEKSTVSIEPGTEW